MDLSLALLVCNCAGSLAGRLAGSLALAAAALLSGLLEISLIDCLDVLHVFYPPIDDTVSVHCLLMKLL